LFVKNVAAVKSSDPKVRQKAADDMRRVLANSQYCDIDTELVLEQLTELDNQRDPWHFVKCFSKALKLAIGTKKSMEVLRLRKKDITDHLWYCLQTSNGDIRACRVSESKTNVLLCRYICKKSD
jgi:hypothetical protein